MTDAPADRALAARLRASIRATGPMPLRVWMAAANAAFYAQPAPIGRAGAFVTAPEVSQIFGELVGLWCVALWRMMGAPPRLRLLELGPGRGVLMDDALRAAGRATPAFLQAATVTLCEASPSLRLAQAARLQAVAPRFIERTDALEPDSAPLIVLANEFFDALGLSQWRRVDGAWVPRAVGLDAGERFAFVDAPGQAPPPPQVAARAADAPEGAWLETREDDAAVMAPLVAEIARSGGAMLVADYGYDDAQRRAAGWRETLQALRGHAVADPLADPGAADLTAHVNFDDLRALAAPLATHGPVGQGAWLRALGAEARAATLARANPAQTEAIALGLHRLTHPNEMGRLFKVFALASPGLPAPGF